MLKAVQRDVMPPPTDDRGEALFNDFRAVLEIERDALTRFLDEAPSPPIGQAVMLLASQQQPIVCTGVGKSGLVAAKVAATFSSLGTPAFFLNASEAAHGDLGAVQSGNVVLLFSNSGSTEEIIRILPMLKARDCQLIGLVGRANSPLGQAVDLCIPVGVEREADHIGMAPTSSTTLQMAVGDALAVSVSQARGFTREDFLRHHPAGQLGRAMIPIAQIMRRGEALPTILPHASAAELLGVVSVGRIGAACVVDWQGCLVGLVTDGDIRRLLQKKSDLHAVRASECMQVAPTTLARDATLGEALALTIDMGLSILPIVEADGGLAGVVHIHDLMLTDK